MMKGTPERGENGPALHHFLINHLFRCPECYSRELSYQSGSLCCSRCRQCYPIFNGVIDFFFRGLEERGPGPVTPVDDQFIRELIPKALLEPSGENEDAIREILVRAEGKTGRQELAESAVVSLAQRFGIEIGNRGSLQTDTADPGILSPPDPDLHYRFEKHYISDLMNPGVILHRNVRIRNTGSSRWSSGGPHPACLCYRWYSVRDRAIVQEGEGTKFPVDIRPFQVISLPLRISTPESEGDYFLEIFPELKGLRTGNEPLSVPVTVKTIPDPRDLLPIRESSHQYSYQEDHANAYALLTEYIGKHDKKTITVLEIGGGCHPQAAWLPDCWMVNLDISLPLLEMGRLFFRQAKKENVIFTCADGMDPPFPPRSFDAVVIFSSLHHFPEPDRLLSRLRELLAPGGFIGIFCEPLNTTLDHPDMIRELNIGINEQVFSLEEYLSMFGSADLRPEIIRVDGGSLKAILKGGA